MQHIEKVLESIVAWSRVLGQGRSLPLGDLRLTRSQIDTLFLIAHSVHPVTPTSVATALAAHWNGRTPTRRKEQHQIGRWSISAFGEKTFLAFSGID